MPVRHPSGDTVQAVKYTHLDQRRDSGWKQSLKSHYVEMVMEATGIKSEGTERARKEVRRLCAGLSSLSTGPAFTHRAEGPGPSTAAGAWKSLKLGQRRRPEIPRVTHDCCVPHPFWQSFLHP